MKISEFDSNVQFVDFENFLDVYENSEGVKTYNLNKTLYLDIQDNILQEYTLDTMAFWSTISYKIYGTTRLMWLLMKINDVNPHDMFTMKTPGEKIKYLDNNIVKEIVRTF